MKVIRYAVMVALVALLSGLTVSAWAMGKAKTTAAAKAAAGDYYMCAKCDMLSTTPGKCPMCGAEMTQTHILAIKDGMAYCCGCGSGCKCKPTDDSMTKCSCGKDIMKVPLKGKYVCNCEGTCKCNTVSDKPGKCGCGVEMKKVE